MPFKTLLFDYDYTLVDSSEGIVLCFNLALQEMGLGPYKPDAIRATIGQSLEESYAILTGDDVAKHGQRFHELYATYGSDRLLAHTHLLPRVGKALAMLQQADYQLGVLSTKASHQIVPVLEQHNLDHYFEIVMGGDHVTQVKPDPEGLLKAIDRMGATIEATLYIGDSPTDGLACANAGVQFCAVLSGVTPREHLEAFAPWLLADDVYALAQHLCHQKAGD